MSGRKQRQSPQQKVNSGKPAGPNRGASKCEQVKSATTIAELMGAIETRLVKYNHLAMFGPGSIRGLYAEIQQIVPINIKVSYEINHGGSRVRFILASRRDKANYSIPLVRQSNGLIFEVFANAEQWSLKLLCIPPNDLIISPAHDQLRDAVTKGKYNIFNVEDGTVFNMYWDIATNAWIRSTKNSTNIDELVWRGYKYADIIDDVLIHRFGSTEVWNIMLGKLRKDLTYSFAYKHPAHHPYGQPAIWKTGARLADKVKTEQPLAEHNSARVIAKKWIADIWLVSVHDWRGKNIDNLDALAPIPRRLALSFNLTLADMLNRNNEATIACPSGITVGPSKHIPHFGYILRSKDGSQPDVLLESKIWTSIRQLIYQMPHANNSADFSRLKDRFNDMNALIMDIFVDMTKKGEFLALFPQYVNTFVNYDKFADDVVARLLDATPTANDLTNSVHVAAEKFSVILASQFKATGDKTDASIFKALILQPTYAHIVNELVTLTI
jgi:hypothetical protein